jgi:hypothetical protein
LATLAACGDAFAAKGDGNASAGASGTALARISKVRIVKTACAARIGYSLLVVLGGVTGEVSTGRARNARGGKLWKNKTKTGLARGHDVPI